MGKDADEDEDDIWNYKLLSTGKRETTLKTTSKSRFSSRSRSRSSFSRSGSNGIGSRVKTATASKTKLNPPVEQGFKASCGRFQNGIEDSHTIQVEEQWNKTGQNYSNIIDVEKEFEIISNHILDSQTSKSRKASIAVPTRGSSLQAKILTSPVSKLSLERKQSVESPSMKTKKKSHVRPKAKMKNKLEQSAVPLERSIQSYCSPSGEKKTRKRNSSKSICFLVCSSSEDNEDEGDTNEVSKRKLIKTDTSELSECSANSNREDNGELHKDRTPVVNVIVENTNELNTPCMSETENARYTSTSKPLEVKDKINELSGGFLTGSEVPSSMDSDLGLGCVVSEGSSDKSSDTVVNEVDTAADLEPFVGKDNTLIESCSMVDSKSVTEEAVEQEVEADDHTQLTNKCDIPDSYPCDKAPALTVGQKQTSIFSFFKPNFSLTRLISSKTSSKEKNVMDIKNKVWPSSSSVSRGGRGQKKQTDVHTTAESPEMSGANVERFKKKQCPFYKKIPGTGITVDAFSYGVIPGCEAYVLTHFHYDHYGGLTKGFAQPIYCSQVTGNLVKSRLGVDPKWVNCLPMWKPCQVAGVTLTLMEANHCPGAVIILFETKEKKKILHTGDFRANPDMEEYKMLKGITISELYLDTTYCNPSYDFPSQREVVDFAVSLAVKHIQDNPQALIVCGAYTIGKERIFHSIAEALDTKICSMNDKKKVLDCLEDKKLKSRLTLNWSEAKVHVLPMGKLNQKCLYEHLARHHQFSSILAFQPTGWTHSKRTETLTDLRPKWSSHSITLYGVPYSEHSSFRELKRFVQFLRPLKILPTVNNGNPESRRKMENFFKQWLSKKN